MKIKEPTDMLFSSFDRPEWLEYLRFQRSHVMSEYYENLMADFSKLIAGFTWVNVIIVSFSILYLTLKDLAFYIVSVEALITGLMLFHFWKKHKKKRNNEIEDILKILDKIDNKLIEGYLKTPDSIHVFYKEEMKKYYKKYKPDD